MDKTSGYAMSFPVFHAQIGNKGLLIQGEVRGTAFSLGSHYMITAGHVIEGIPSSGNEAAIVGLVDSESRLIGATIVDFELLGSDLALLKVQFPSVELSDSVNHFSWVVGQPSVFETVRSVGYAYGLHSVEGRLSCIVRGFQGHIVSGLIEFKPVGSKDKPFQAYELSFLAPRGLSGAPLFTTVGKPLVLGVVIGNSNSRMLVFQSQETVRDGSEQLKIEQYESLQLGIAVQGAEVFRKRSRLLSMSLEEHLRSYNLLAIA